MIAEVFVIASLACGKHTGPYPLPAPGVKKCASVMPSVLVCSSQGTQIFCPRAMYVLQGVVLRRVRP